MSRDILGDAVHALREETSGETEEAHATRMRIAGTVRAARRRKVAVTRGAVLLLAAALGSTAWAAATGRFPSMPALTRLLGGLESTGSDPRAGAPESASPARPTAGVGSQAPAELAPTGDAPATAPEAPAGSAVNESAPVAAESVPRAAGGSDARGDRAPGADRAPAGDRSPGGDTPLPSDMASSAKKPLPAGEPAPGDRPAPATAATSSSAATTATSAAAPASTSADAATDTDALYQRAHALHFQAHDHAAARAAWEAYLRAAPTGRYATLAHYNRALCLVRLGRREEAKRALQPFASGAAGGYRRAEARSLLEALEARP